MEGIEIGKAIAEYGVPVITGIFLVLFCRLVMYFVTQQTEDRTYYRTLVTNDMKDLHNDSIKNADLNKQTISLIKKANEEQREHNGHSKKAWDKTIDTLSIMCDRLNGGNSKIVEAKNRLNKDRRKKDISVKVERRA